MNEEPQNQLTVLPAPVPEEFPLTPDPASLTPGGDAPLFIDVGQVAWSKLPIAEITPGTWFKYDKFEGTDSTVFNISDGNGRTLFHVCEEEIAAFAVKSMNLYVQAALSTQTQA